MIHSEWNSFFKEKRKKKVVMECLDRTQSSLGGSTYAGFNLMRLLILVNIYFSRMAKVMIVFYAYKYCHLVSDKLTHFIFH